MSIFIFCAVLFAALLHAGWNVLIKTGANKQKSMLLMSVSQCVVGGAIILFRDLPSADVWIWIFASGFIHCAYQLFLAYAYEQGDLSRVYPIARGAAPFIVLIVSFAIGLDAISRTEFWGVLVLGLGILIMANGVFTSGESRKMLPFAFGSALATAGYSLVDGMGARVMGDPLGYVAWLMMITGFLYAGVIRTLKGTEPFQWSMREVGSGGVAAVVSFAAYVIAVWAMTQAPIALVTALRESSIFFAMVLGWLIFGEKMSPSKIMAGALIVAGVAITRF